MDPRTMTPMELSLSERFWWLGIGCFVGFVLGYIVARLRDIGDKVDHVDSVVTKRNEAGKVNWIIINRVALGLVVAFTAFAAFQSQAASNKAQANQEAIANLAVCNQVFLSKVITALNGRTTYTTAQATANVKLQNSQLEFFSIFNTQPPPSHKVSLTAFKKYIHALTHFSKITGKSKKQIKQFPFPTNKGYARCLNTNHQKE